MKTIALSIILASFPVDYCGWGHVAYPTDEWVLDEDGWFERYRCAEGHEIWIQEDYYSEDEECEERSL